MIMESPQLKAWAVAFKMLRHLNEVRVNVTQDKPDYEGVAIHGVCAGITATYLHTSWDDLVAGGEWVASKARSTFSES